MTTGEQLRELVALLREQQRATGYLEWKAVEAQRRQDWYRRHVRPETDAERWERYAREAERERRRP